MNKTKEKKTENLCGGGVIVYQYTLFSAGKEHNEK